MIDLERMTLTDMASASTRLRKLGQGARSMAEASQRVVRLLFDELGGAEGKDRSCALVRLYKTHPFGGLPPDVQAFAQGASPDAIHAEAPCLVLLGSVGVESEWCSLEASRGHRAIALPSEATVARLPMVAQLVSQLGFDVASLVRGAPTTVLDPNERTFNVFHVPDAPGSPYIPAQDFVVRYGVKSVLGFGGQLPDGQIYAVILFSKVSIPRETADTFKPLPLATKLALIPFLTRVFDEASS